MKPAQERNNQDEDWCFIPYNINSDERGKTFKQYIEDAHLDYNKLRDIQYLKENLSAIKNCYDNLPDGINGNSMMVYSGPQTNGHIIRYHSFDSCNRGCIVRNRYPKFMNRAACLFTGDISLNETNLNNIAHPYKDFIGTIQVPHHGSVLSFNQSHFIQGPVFAPMSFGRDNTFGHPSAKVLDSLLRLYCVPIHIIDDMGSMYVQVIE